MTEQNAIKAAFLEGYDAADADRPGMGTPDECGGIAAWDESEAKQHLSAAPLRPQANTDGPSARLRRLATGECFFDGDELREIADCIDRLLPPAPPLDRKEPT